MDINSIFAAQSNACSASDPWTNALSDIFLPLVVRPVSKRISSSAASYSHYFEPIDYSEGRLSGYSRNYGDASSVTQMGVMQKILDYSVNLPSRDRAMLLAIARVESGFNPDAAATSTSASGVFQFINNTGKAYGLSEVNRFDADANVQAGVRSFNDNLQLLNKKYPELKGTERDVFLYALHHDGPSLQYGGEGIARTEILPYLERFQLAVDEYDARSASMTPST